MSYIFTFYTSLNMQWLIFDIFFWYFFKCIKLITLNNMCIKKPLNLHIWILFLIQMMLLALSIHGNMTWLWRNVPISIEINLYWNPNFLHCHWHYQPKLPSLTNLAQPNCISDQANIMFCWCIEILTKCWVTLRSRESFGAMRTESFGHKG